MSVRDEMWMPAKVRDRPDEFPLWGAFRRFVGMAWSGRDEDAFIAGWDAAMKHAAASGKEQQT